jgi:pimeloyl-ACP methyl ester carboxylesterase
VAIPVPPNTHWSARLRVLILLVALLASCTGGGNGEGDGSSNAEPDAAGFGSRVLRPTLGTDATARPPADDVPGYAVTYRPQTCPFATRSANGLTVDCGELVVPMNRANPAGATVSLAVAVVRSTSPAPRPDPVLYLAGGPGGSAIASVDMWTRPMAPILIDRDLILVDQRGTGYSKPRLECTNLRDSDYVSDFASLAENCRRVLTNQHIDVAAFNTTESAADLADLRRALRLKEWNLFGISYGTRLALVAMQTQPYGIRSVVLDSAYPPGARSLDEIPADLSRAIHALSVDCAAQPACGAHFPDVEGQLYRAVDQLNQASRGTGDDYVSELFQAMYMSEIMPDIPKAIGLAAAGEIGQSIKLLEGAGALARHPELIDNGPPSSARTRPSMSEALYHSVECAESVPFTTPDRVRAASKLVAPEIAAELTRSNLRQLALCRVWDVPPRELAEVHSDIPTLVLAGTYDPITPPAWGERAAATLSHATYVLVNGSGHAVWASGDCPKQLVREFVDDPTAAGPDCRGAPPDFSL